MSDPYHEACQARMRRRFSHAGPDPARREIRSSAQRKTLPPCAPVASRAFARDPQTGQGGDFSAFDDRGTVARVLQRSEGIVEPIAAHERKPR